MNSAQDCVMQGPAPLQQALARLKGSIKTPEIPKQLLYIRYKSFLSLIPDIARETALPVPARRIKEERCSAALAPYSVGPLPPSKGWDLWPRVWRGESPGMGWSSARDIHYLWDCFE